MKDLLNTSENITIANFLGFTFDNNRWYDNEEVLELPNSGDNTFDELLFDKDWNWLMVVVSYIVSDFKFNEREAVMDSECKENIMDIVPFGRIEDTYDSVVEFIKWYNNLIDS